MGSHWGSWKRMNTYGLCGQASWLGRPFSDYLLSSYPPCPHYGMECMSDKKCLSDKKEASRWQAPPDYQLIHSRALNTLLTLKEIKI